MDRINELFNHLDDWRDFPDYQLERRADIFFSLYLREVLEWKLGFPISEQIVPEFPVHQRLIEDKVNSENADQEGKKVANTSKKIDYFALSADGRIAILVELKTEVKSRRKKQDAYLTKARDAKPPGLLEGIRTIFLTTNAKTKYYCLLKRLAEMKLIYIPQEVEEILFSDNHRGLTKAAKSIRITTKAADCRLVYIQPDPTSSEDISLEDFSKVVEMHNDPLSKRFAQSLRYWSRQKAGAGG